MPAEPADVVRELFRRFEDGQDPFPLMAADIVWEVPMLDMPESAFRGHRGVAEFFRRWLGTWDAYRIDLRELTELDDGRVFVALSERARGRGSGAEVELAVAALVTVADAKVTHYRSYLDRDEALAAAGVAA